ncbi:MAG: hypothetical protein ACYTHM_00195 [Planctomycetota bacterium]|jgi:hypothetical protein
MIKKGFLIAAGILCLVLAGYLIYRMVRPSDDYGPELPPVRMRLAETVVPRAVGSMRSQLPPDFFHAVLLHFEGHRNAHDIRKMVEDQIVDQKKLRLHDFEEIVREEEESEGWLAKGKSILSNVAASLGLEKPTPDSKMKKVMNAAGVQGFVGGKVDFTEDSPKEERLALTLYATDAEGKRIWSETYEESIRKSLLDMEYYRIKLDEIGVGWKLLMWLVFTLALPVLTFFIPVKVMKSESNGAILAALVGYTVLDGVVVLALMGFMIGGFFSFLVLLIALTLSAVYNYGIFTEIKDFM